MEVTLVPGVVWDSVEDGGFPSNSRLVFQNISSYGHMCLDTAVEDIHGHTPATSGISITPNMGAYEFPGSPERVFMESPLDVIKVRVIRADCARL